MVSLVICSSDNADRISEVPSTPKSLFHSVGPTPSPSAPQTSQRSTTAASEDEDIPTASQGGSSEATAERERREEWEELTRDPHFRGIGPYGWAEYDSSTAPDSADRSEATGATPEWVYQENATPNSHYDSEGNSIAYTMPTASNDDQDMHTPSHENETASHDDQEMYTPSHENATASSDAQELYTSSHENATASSDAQDMYTSSHENATASSDAQEMYTTSRENEMVSAASVHLPATFAPPGRELGALSVHDSEQGVTQSIMDEAIAVLNAQDKGKGRETSLGVGTMMSTGPEAEDKGKGKEASSSIGENCSYASQNQQKGKGKQTISDFGNAYMDDGEERHGNTGSGRAKLDVAASLRNHSVTFLDETLPKIKERSPPVPQPEKMPGTLTQAICNYIPLEAKSILTLTLERVDSPVPSPTDQRCVLLKHFEVGLDGVEGLCQGTAKIPETPERIAERERRIGKIGTFKQGDGGFYRSLKSAQQKEQQYGKGYWYFFGVKFKQTGREKKLRRGGKWLLFGAPIEAVYHLDIKRTQENVAILLGGGVDQFGTAIKPFKANFKRTHTLFSRGGIAPMDIWSGGEDWDDGVFRDIRAATANNGLRVGFLYADTQTFTPRPMGFPAAGKLQAEKKRKQSGPEMTEDEMKAMEKRMKPKKLSDEDIGAILAMRIINDRAREDAAARSK